MFFKIPSLISKMGQIKKDKGTYIKYPLISIILFCFDPFKRLRYKLWKTNSLAVWKIEAKKNWKLLLRFPDLYPLSNFKEFRPLSLNNCRPILWTAPLGALLLPPVRHSRKFYKGILFYCAEWCELGCEVFTTQTAPFDTTLPNHKTNGFIETSF